MHQQSRRKQLSQYCRNWERNNLGSKLKLQKDKGPTAQSSQDAYPPHATTAVVAGCASNSTPWSADLQSLGAEVTGEINEIRKGKDTINNKLEARQATQQCDSNLLPLMSIKLGPMDPNPSNPLEMATAWSKS